MKTPSRVVWSEGMLLSSQHLQAQERYFEGLIEQRVAALSPYSWGAVTMEFDERALESGHLALRTFFGVLPLGSVIRVESGHPEAPAGRPIAPHFPAHQELLEVFLGLPLARVGGATYARSEAERGRCRYVIETQRVLDTVTRDAEDAVDFGHRNTQLLFGDESREDTECLKVAEIVRDGAGKLVLSSSYVVPALRVSVAPFLVQGFRRVLALVSSRRRAVAEERQHRDGSAAEFATDDVTRYLALSALSASMPVLAHIAEGEIAPHQAYLALVQLAGQLTAFSVDEEPGNLPPYAHGDLRQTFEQLFAKVTSMLRVAASVRAVSIPLDARPDGIHLGRIPDPQLFKTGVRFVLSVQTQVPEHQALELLPRVAKVASWGDIPRLVNAALPGVPLIASPRPPREISMRPGRCYFSVSIEHGSWAGVVQERAIAVHLPPTFDPKTTMLELFAIPRE